MIKVLLVDDHTLVRTSIKYLLQDSPDIKIVGEADNGEEGVRMTKKLMPDIVLMDMLMPGISGLEATRKIVKHNPDIKVIALTIYCDEPYPSRFLQAGAMGYITKNCTADNLIQVIRKTYAGQRYISPRLNKKLALKHPTKLTEKLSTMSGIEQLSERELQTMLMVAQGETTQQIAKKLCLSMKTINSYRYRIFEKLHIENDVQLVLLANRLGLTK